MIACDRCCDVRTGKRIIADSYGKKAEKINAGLYRNYVRFSCDTYAKTKCVAV